MEEGEIEDDEGSTKKMTPKVEETTGDQDEPQQDKNKERGLRIDTASMPPPSDVGRKRPGNLDLSLTKTPVPAPLPSALASA